MDVHRIRSHHGPTRSGGSTKPRRTIDCVRNPIGPRWLTWIVLAYGLLEIPWVIYLAFFQVRTGTAQHTHLAALGLAGFGALVALVAAWALLRDGRWAPVAAVAAATWLAVGLFFGLVVSSLHVVWAGIPGATVAGVGAWFALRQRRCPRWIPVVLAVVAVFLLLNLTRVVGQTSTSLDADHLRILIVLYDSAEVASLLGLGLSLRAGAARAAIAFGSAGAVLFFLDAYINVVVVPGGQAFIAAVFYAVVGEFPSIAMCIAGVVLAMRRWHPDPVSCAHRAPQPQL